jgi:hypothetical protein
MPLSAGYFYKTLLIDTTISIYGTTWGLGWFYIGVLSSVVYFYKIYVYLLFDFYKNVKYLIVTRLISVPVKLANYSFMRWSTFLGILILLITGVLIVSFYYIFNDFWLFGINDFEETLNYIWWSYLDNNQLFPHLYALLYLSYVFIVMLCVIRNNSRSSMFLAILYVLIYLVLFFL